ncbi:G-protein coupled receptor 35 [Talpa occidentalis]|uniref:G-protein coupled receptor 35 n=1 Tax=Talpa occidentalis TaxID=50954 RepID=UPI00188F8350|nr:G-protein coupled receptor 35 [Talpa occidentalis]
MGLRPGLPPSHQSLRGRQRSALPWRRGEVAGLFLRGFSGVAGAKAGGARCPLSALPLQVVTVQKRSGPHLVCFFPFDLTDAATRVFWADGTATLKPPATSSVVEARVVVSSVPIVESARPSGAAAPSGSADTGTVHGPGPLAPPSSMPGPALCGLLAAGRSPALPPVDADLLSAGEPGPAPAPRRLGAGQTASRPLPRTMSNCSSSNCSAHARCEALQALGWPEHVLKAYAGALLVLGLLLNGAALWVLCCRLPRWTETRVYMVNLAVADLCLLCSLPSMLRSLREEDADSLRCQLSQAVYLANRYMSISLITVIALDRYLAVRHPLWARRLRSPRRAGVLCAALWVLVAVSLGARWLLGQQEGGFCFSNPARQNSSTIVFSLLGFYLPLAVLVFCSLQVVATLARRPAGDAAQAEATRRATHMVWANLVVFVVCFLPLHLVLTARLAGGPQASCPMRYALLLTSHLSYANCCLDAVCYYYMAREFQEASAPRPSAKARLGQDSVSMTLARGTPRLGRRDRMCDPGPGDTEAGAPGPRA